MLNRVFRAVMMPPPAITVDEWAERYVRIPAGSAKPGPLRLNFTEYQRGILRAVSDPAVHTVVWQASSQVGKSTVELVILGYYASVQPSPIMFVQPNSGLAQDFGKERVTPFFNATPILRDLMPKGRTRDTSNTLGHKEFSNGSNLTLVGAESPAGLASRPKRICLLDEVDRYPASAGSEGDPVTLAVKRTTTYFDRKIIMVSSPGLAGVSRIEAAYIEGDQRKFYVPCPDCDHYQTLEWERVSFDRDADNVLIKESVVFTCEECGSCWNDAQRHIAVRHGEWRAGAHFNGTASFHISELYSPFVSLHETVANFLAAKSNPERLKTWKNTSLALTWQEVGEAPDDQLVYDRRDKTFMLTEVSNWVAILTAGTDVQKDRLECDIWGWGAEQRRALIDHIVIEGDTSTTAPWNELTKVLSRTWKGANGSDYSLSRMAVDCGYNTTSAYIFVRGNSHKVIAVKGASNYDTTRPVSAPSSIDVRIGSRTIKNGIKLYSVSGAAYKSELYSRLRLERLGDIEPPGWVSLPGDVTIDWVQQLTAEEMVTERMKTGKTRLVWRNIRPRNEALDCAVYARAAAHLLGLDSWLPERWSEATGIPVPTDVPVDPEDAQQPPAPAPALAVRDATAPPRPSTRPSGSWMGRLRR